MLMLPLLLLIRTVGASSTGSRHIISNPDQSHNNALPQVSAAERAVTKEIGMPTAKLEERLDRDVSMDLDYHDPRPRYRFEYGVRDETTGDYKSHYEQRDGEYVQGHYELLEPDGRTLRSVHYSSGGAAGGFVATVSRIPTNGETQDTIPEPTGYSSEGEERPSTEISNRKEKLTHVKKKAALGYNQEKKAEMDDSYQDEQQNHRDRGEGKIAYPREKNESGNTYKGTKGRKGHGVKSTSKYQMDYYTSRNPTVQVHQEYDKNLGYNENKYVTGESADENSGKPHNRGKTSENGKSNQVVKNRYEEEPKHEGKYAESYGYSGREYGKSAVDEKKIYDEEGKHDGNNYDDHGYDGENYNEGKGFYGDGEDSSEIKDYDSEYNYWENHGDYSDSTNKDPRDKRHHYEFDENSGVSGNDKSPYSDNEDLRERRPQLDYDESNGSSENSNKGTSHYNDYEDLSEKIPHYQYDEDSGSLYGKDTNHYGGGEDLSEKRPHNDYDENSESSENSKGTNQYSDYEDLSDKRPHYDENSGSSYGKDASHYSNDGYLSDKRPPYDHDENSENSDDGPNHNIDGEFREEVPNYEIQGNDGISERDEPRRPIGHNGGKTKQYNDYEDGTYSSKQIYNSKNASQYGNANRKLKEKRLQSPKLRGTISQHKDNNGKRFEAVKPVRENVKEPAPTENPNKLQQVQAPALDNRTRKGRGRGKRLGLATSYMNYGKTRANARVRQQLISMLYSKTNDNGSSVKEHKTDPKKKLGKRENLTQNRPKLVKKESPSDDPVTYRSTSYWGYQR